LLLEGVVHRDQTVGIDDDLFGQLLDVERSVQSAPFLVASRAGDAAVKNAGEYCARLGDLRERLSDELGDYISGMCRLPGRDR